METSTLFTLIHKEHLSLKFSAGSLVAFLCFSNNVTPSQEWENACILVKFWKFMFFCFENLKLWTVKLLDFSGGIYMVKHFLVRLQMQYLEQRVKKILSLIFQIISIINSEAATQSVLRKRCSENMQQIYRRTLWHGCSPVNLLHIFRTPKSTSG